MLENNGCCKITKTTLLTPAATSLNQVGAKSTTLSRSITDQRNPGSDIGENHKGDVRGWRARGRGGCYSMGCAMADEARPVDCSKARRVSA